MSGSATKQADAYATAHGGKQVGVSLKSLCSELKCVHAIKAKRQTVAQLDSLPQQRSNGDITSEEAVERLDSLVGAALVRQVAMILSNAQRSCLPRGWLEYRTADGKPYFFDVYSQTTTWCVQVCGADAKLGGRQSVQMSTAL